MFRSKWLETDVSRNLDCEIEEFARTDFKSFLLVINIFLILKFDILSRNLVDILAETLQYLEGQVLHILIINYNQYNNK